MIRDNNLLLASAQVVTAAAASTNYIDTTKAGLPGLSELALCITCDQSATAAGAGTVQFQLQHDNDNAFGTVVTEVESDAIGKASLTAGMEPIYLPIPAGVTGRYIRLYFNVETGPLTAGKFSVAVVRKSDIQKSKAFAAANYN